MHPTFEDWKAELISTGAIVQDADESVPWPEREDRFNRYVALLDAIVGTEGFEAACAIIQSIQVKDDYGAYQSTQRALGRFPVSVWVSALIFELPSLIGRQPEWAGELLCGLANSRGTKFESNIAEFRKQLAVAPDTSRFQIRQFIKFQENGRWLEHRVGVL